MVVAGDPSKFLTTTGPDGETGIPLLSSSERTVGSSSGVPSFVIVYSTLGRFSIRSERGHISGVVVAAPVVVVAFTVVVVPEAHKNFCYFASLYNAFVFLIKKINEWPRFTYS